MAGLPSPIEIVPDLCVCAYDYDRDYVLRHNGDAGLVGDVGEHDESGDMGGEAHGAATVVPLVGEEGTSTPSASGWKRAWLLGSVSHTALNLTELGKGLQHWRRSCDGQNPPTRTWMWSPRYGVDQERKELKN